MALCISAFLVVEHLTAYNNPAEQKWLISVICMVPVYTLSAFFSLWRPELTMVCDSVRNCYEAYTIYAFGSYLMACLGGEERVIEKLEGQGVVLGSHQTPLLKSRQNSISGEELYPYTPLKDSLEDPPRTWAHPLLLKFLVEPWSLGSHFYQKVKFGIVQYMIVKLLFALLALLLDAFGLYRDGELNVHKGYVYLALILNFSQAWALYCLYQFYTATKEYLAPIRPWPKFLCIKAIIFITWWQGFLLNILFSLGVVRPPDSDLAGGKFQTSLQDFIICIEMCIAGIAHVYVFPAAPYQEVEGSDISRDVSVLADLAAGDVPPEPGEIMESERQGLLRYLPPGGQQTATSLSASVQDILFNGSEHVVRDVRHTVSQAVEPMERGFNLFSAGLESIQGQLGRVYPWGGSAATEEKPITKDDSWLPSTGQGQSSQADEPVGSVSDSGLRKGRRQFGSVSDALERGQGRR
eukprot:SM000001S04797  [mRNA]  locus=s1:2298545:2301906:- [translate_table: standard]